MRVLDSSDNMDSFIKENKISMIYFSSNACNVCVGLLPKIGELMEKYRKIAYVKVDIDKLQSVVGKYSIFTLPAIILFIDGKEIIREARFISIVELEKKIQRFYDLV
ncbi:thioredoxin [Clostridium pasteurianum DSM 525 = ATCC 6013]|uniref:Thioredoxin n=1 Tax=Clostridium pasteurianum DSM 525 = ATCC 6013 TaxID=1262449 RepID=A0A0H3J3H0_CLOPA|nr:thioredoxin family protein [Clostridium pasteurianum]AJA48471.1 thioredoxin [Clostridium pasteurianum DSM 525 = ATCC 6013]AJA52459.1 thioredoxin [Clostridium pasteurianum DSM 525 = ATCC 6013]AOZ75713.1 thioredoxin [Clostridium pasteurianum DSM 525 = ATCC 6013]AOZ79509.1 thioredoxin [Clostridium pasteurianum]ELP60381.1 thioredoxin [Clostridium pasteurianum DSM 525 = ATCC 6013]